MISHRLSSVKLADRILFFKEGRIIADGSHFAEEYVIINIKTKEVIPTPHSFWMREGGHNVLRKKYNLFLDGIEKYLFHYENRFLYPSPILQQTTKRYYLDVCLLPKISADAVPQITRLNDPKNYVVNSFSPMDMKKNLVGALCLAEKLPMYNLLYENLETLYSFLKNIQKRL